MNHSVSTDNKTAVLAIILVSYLMLVLDISIVITALPKIQAEMHISAADLTWMQTAYTLFFGGLLLLGARAGDILGRRKMFIVGLALFTAASLVIGLSQSLIVLIVSRAVQGIGAAILAPSTLALLQTNFAEGPERTRAVAYYGATAGVAASIGLVLGGILADLISWRVGFFINIPIGIVLIWAAKKYITETELHTGEFDFAGAISSTLGVGALVYGFVHAAKVGWRDSETIISLSAGVGLIAFLIFNESRAKQPIMPLRLFAHRKRVGAFVGRMFFLGAMVGFWFFTTQFMQGVLGFRPLQAGFGFLPNTLVNFAVAMMVPKLVRKFGNAHLMAGSMIIGLMGLIWLSQVTITSTYWMGVAFPMILIGGAQGGILAPMVAFGITEVAPRDAGAASGLINVAHQLGASLGLSILAVVFANAGLNLQEPRAILASKISAAITGGAVMMAISLIIVYLLIVHDAKKH